MPWHNCGNLLLLQHNNGTEFLTMKKMILLTTILLTAPSVEAQMQSQATQSKQISGITRQPIANDLLTDNYPLVARMEKITFGLTKPGLEIQDRLDSLEQAVFQTSYRDESLFDQVKRLKSAVIDNNKSLLTEEQRAIVTGLENRVSNLELQTWHTTFKSDPLKTRIDKLLESRGDFVSSGYDDNSESALLRRMIDDVNRLERRSGLSALSPLESGFGAFPGSTANPWTEYLCNLYQTDVEKLEKAMGVVPDKSAPVDARLIILEQMTYGKNFQKYNQMVSDIPIPQRFKNLEEQVLGKYTPPDPSLVAATQKANKKAKYHSYISYSGYGSLAPGYSSIAPAAPPPAQGNHAGLTMTPYAINGGAGGMGTITTMPGGQVLINGTGLGGQGWLSPVSVPGSHF